MVTLSNIFSSDDEEIMEQEFIRRMEEQEKQEEQEEVALEADEQANGEEIDDPSSRVSSNAPDDDIEETLREVDELAAQNQDRPEEVSEQEAVQEGADKSGSNQGSSEVEDEAAADPFEAGTDVKSLPVEASTPAARAQLDFMDRNSAIVTCGDEKPEDAPVQQLTIDQKMQAIGFPTRPRMWPSVMAWPMQPDFNMLARKKASEEELRKYLEGMQLLQKRMLERAKQIDEYIRKYNNPEDSARSKWRQSLKYPTFGAIRYFRKYDYLNNRAVSNIKQTELDPYYGVRWACLLDEKSTRPAANIVSTWSYNYAKTNDGGVVLTDQDSIRFREITQQAVALAIHEGVARGWETINMQGYDDFAKHAIQAAKQANVRAVITEFYGPFGIFKRKHVVTPTPPGVSADEPRVETKNIGATPDSPQARKPAEDADKQNAAENPKKKNGKASKEILDRLKVKPDSSKDADVAVDEPSDAASGTEVIPNEEDEIAWTDDSEIDFGMPEHNRPQ